MKTKIRGIIGLGLIGALLGFVGGGLWGLVSSVVRSGFYWDADYARFLMRMATGNAIGFMKIGGFTAAGFGLVLSTVGWQTSLEELSLWRMALLGAFVGASFPPIYAILQMGFSAYVETAETFARAMLGLACVGAALGTSLVAVAKRANRDELPPRDQVADALPSTDQHSASVRGPME